MIRQVLIILFLVKASFIYSNEIEIQIPKDKKVVETYSATIDENYLFQTYLLRDKKTYNFEMYLLFFDRDKAKKMDKINLKKYSVIKSFQFNGNILTLIMMTKNSKNSNLLIADINVVTGASKTKLLEDIIEKEVDFIGDGKKTVFYYRKKNKINFVVIENSENIKTKRITFDKKSTILNAFFGKNQSAYTAIYTNKYVMNGTIKKRSLFYENNKMYFINTNKLINRTNVLRFDLDNLEAYEILKITNDKLPKIKDYNSYLYREKVFTVVVNKNDAILKVIDFNTKKEYNMYLKKNLLEATDTILVNTFLKKVVKNAYKPTITANESIDGNIVVNIDYKEVDKYQYRYNHFVDRIWMNQMMNNYSNWNLPVAPIRKGPNGMFDLDYYFLDKEKTMIQFVLSTDFKLLKNASKETKFNSIDVEEFVKKYKKVNTMKYASIAFSSKKSHLIYYVKKERKIKLMSAIL